MALAILADAVVVLAMVRMVSMGSAWEPSQGRWNATRDNPEPELLPDCCLIGVFGHFRPSSLLKNLEMERFVILSGRCWDGAVELDVIF